MTTNATPTLPDLTYVPTTENVAEDVYEVYGTHDPGYLLDYNDLVVDEFLHDRPLADWRRVVRSDLRKGGLL